MWSKEFESFVSPARDSIFHSDTRWYKCIYNGQPIFVKEFLRNRDGEQETIEDHIERIERSERTNQFFISQGINGAQPISFDDSYTHLYCGRLFVAYQWLSLYDLCNSKETCYKIGKLVARIHSIGSVEAKTPFEKTETLNIDEYTSLLRDFLTLIPCKYSLHRILDLAKVGLTSYHSLHSAHVLSHGDIHLGNIKQNTDGELFLLDWEHSGYYHPGIDLFDTALNMCGYLQSKVDLSLFDSIIKGYFESSIIYFYAGEIPQIVKSMYYYESVYIFHMLQTIRIAPTNIKKIHEHLNKLFELDKYASSFADILKTRYSIPKDS